MRSTVPDDGALQEVLLRQTHLETSPTLEYHHKVDRGNLGHADRQAGDQTHGESNTIRPRVCTNW